MFCDDAHKNGRFTRAEVAYEVLADVLILLAESIDLDPGRLSNAFVDHRVVFQRKSNAKNERKWFVYWHIETDKDNMLSMGISPDTSPIHRYTKAFATILHATYPGEFEWKAGGDLLEKVVYSRWIEDWPSKTFHPGMEAVILECRKLLMGNGHWEGSVESFPDIDTIKKRKK